MSILASCYVQYSDLSQLVHLHLMKLSLCVPWNLPGPFNHVKSSLLGSTSDSNINKYSTIHKIPLIALNFSEGTEKKPHSPPTSETTIIAPKVKDRTHNVTKKVTQVSCTHTTCFLIFFILETYLWCELGNSSSKGETIPKCIIYVLVKGKLTELEWTERPVSLTLDLQGFLLLFSVGEASVVVCQKQRTG